MLMGLQDAARGQMGVTRVQVTVLHARVPEEQLKESQKQVQEKEQSGDREKSREKVLLPTGVQNLILNSPHSPVSCGVSKRKACPNETSGTYKLVGYLNSD